MPSQIDLVGSDGEDGADGSSAASAEAARWIDGISAADLAQSQSIKPLGTPGVGGKGKVRTKKPASASDAAPIAKLAKLNPAEMEALKKATLKRGTNGGVTKHVAMDCEMVGIGAGGEASYLARYVRKFWCSFTVGVLVMG